MIDIFSAVTAGKEFVDVLQELRQGSDWTRKRREEQFWKYLRDRADEFSTKETAQQFADRISDLKYREQLHGILFSNWRTLMEAIDESIIPYIAAMTLEYLNSGRPVDRFFKSFSRMLSEMTFADLTAFKSLVLFSIEALKNKQQKIPTTEIIELHLGAKQCWIGYLPEENRIFPPQPLEHDMIQVLDLMDQHHLFEKALLSRPGGSARSCLKVKKETLDRFKKYLCL